MRRIEVVNLRKKSKSRYVFIDSSLIVNSFLYESLNPFPQNWGTEGVKPRGLLRGFYFLVSSPEYFVGK